MAFLSGEFWWGLAAVVWVNVALSCDNAVVIALAARALPQEQRARAVAWGAAAATASRIALTLVAAELLKLPFLRIAGALLILWLAVRMTRPDGGGGAIAPAASLASAIRTIVMADLMMSLDNVLAVAAAAQGSTACLIAGLAISMPFVMLGAAFLVKVMERWPAIIVAGAAILGWVAGGMLITDPAVSPWIATLDWIHIRPLNVSWAEVAGALAVVAASRWFTARA